MAAMAAGGAVPETDAKGGEGGGESHEGLIDNLQRKNDLMSQLFAAVKEAQKDDISVETWKAKIRELEAARASNKALTAELAQAKQREAALLAQNEGLTSQHGAVAAQLATRDGQVGRSGERGEGEEGLWSCGVSRGSVWCVCGTVGDARWGWSVRRVLCVVCLCVKDRGGCGWWRVVWGQVGESGEERKAPGLL